MNELASRYGAQGFHIVAVSDEDAGLIGDYVRDKGVTYGVARAKGVLRSYGGRGYPSSWLVDPQGNIVWEGHPMRLSGDVIEPLLASVGSAVPATPGTTTGASSSGGNWWVWLIVFSGVFFAGALGWFWWSSRDRTPSIQAVLYGQQPPQQGPPQGPPPQGPPPQGPPPQGAPPPQGGQYGAPPPQPPHGAPQQQPPGAPQHGGYLTDGAQQTGYSAGLANNQLQGRAPGVGAGNAYGGQESLVSNTEFRKKQDDAPYLGGDQQEPPPPLPPQDNEPPPLPPYDPNQHRPR